MRERGRRRFLKAAAVATGWSLAGGLGGIFAARRAPAFPKGAKLRLLQWASPVTPADDVHRELAARFRTRSRIEVTVETVEPNDLQRRTTKAVTSGSGPDIIQMLYGWPHVYAHALLDVDDVAEPIGRRDGGYDPQIAAACTVDGRFKAVPFCIVPLAVVYRADWLREIGEQAFPDTWDRYRWVGSALKAMRRPFGQALSRSFGDPNGFVYPLLYSFGGRETEPDGKTVALASKETEESVKFCVGLFKEALDDGGVAWDDRSNNRAYLAQTISATLNGASIYLAATRRFPAIARASSHAPLPQGPAGRFHWLITQEHAIMKYSKQPEAAKEYLGWLMEREQWGSWFRVQHGYSAGPTAYWDQDPLWETDPKIRLLRDIRTAEGHGRYPGPTTAKAAQTLSRYILVDMYAKAVLGTPPRQAIRWAADELKQIYGR